VVQIQIGYLLTTTWLESREKTSTPAEVYLCCTKF